MKIKSILLLLVAFVLAVPAFSQSDEAKVKAVIESLFDGMRSKNPDQIAAVFSENAIMQTIESHGEYGEVKAGSVEQFVQGIGSLPADTELDEKITDYQIKIDGDMATAWTPYEFYLNGNFSHCGVNSFQLVRMAEGWKVVYIIDTRRKEGCVS
ncbi:nuclear transport factor 2 family protein [Algoriphagus halophytocola]|uniref:Nuclear transport factor 2 family protein n=1 Tax=Algoriphagus halophytocola TaxID=2991499 RepID=A0ABY6MC33_9BACT|nr:MULTISPECIES: nuclear transport factor 2 family protein [unclassified Algoriphagus]UZD20988.1 nuclear transport factor 2 family protein [Algoriphagus sp. TR-M5]WBL42154.1 nuclear transport factor 2 family protein [Algoriphagus sp. TR-M9]